MSSILPSNSTDLEIALEDSFSRDLPLLIAQQWNPDTCPEEFLGYLAWGLAVGEWSDDWDEYIKRAVLNNIMTVHKTRGTIGAVRAAMAALDVSIDLVEWFESGGTGNPYTAELIAYAQNNLDPNGSTLLTAELQATLLRVVNNTKNVRTHLDFTVGVKFSNDLSVGCAATQCSVRRDDITLVADQDINTAPTLAAGATDLDITRITADLAANILTAAKGLLTNAVTPAIDFNRVSMNLL